MEIKRRSEMKIKRVTHTHMCVRVCYIYIYIHTRNAKDDVLTRHEDPTFR